MTMRRRVEVNLEELDQIHVEQRGARDLEERHEGVLATRPVLVSHSSSRALANHPRNLTDAQLKAVARNPPKPREIKQDDLVAGVRRELRKDGKFVG